MQEHCDTTGGTAPSDSELVRRIRAAAPSGGRAADTPFGTPAPDGPARTGQSALNEFHQRHYAAVLAYARDCCRSSQAAADLAKEAINHVLHSPGPEEEGADPAWRTALLAAVRHTAAAWHRTARNTELRDDFTTWLAAQEAAGADRADGTGPSGAGGAPPAGLSFSGTALPDAPDKPRRARFTPARITVLAVAVAVLAGVAISVGPLLGTERDDAAAGHRDRSDRSSAPATEQPPSARTSATASRSPAASPSPTHSKKPKRPSSRPSSPPKPSHSPRPNPGHADKPPAGHTTPLGSRPWSSQKYSFAPFRQDSSIDGHPLTIQGAAYSQGLGAHAYDEVTYDLGGSCSALTVDVGLDDEVGANGSVVFQIYRDATKVADSGLMTVDQPAKHLTADLTGGSQLRLVVTDGGNGNDSDHADWGGPQITCH
ncbi:NPCBM/NEW2 domain-containing protein [Streptomyces sp. DSM 41527]|uniref:NPCBM/NEW2 domain-containing protein n=1 Tax=Streptomyces mooreae TaxID=3075523 RepID=A0ABU2T774_9ACTN|nr:NPCBM/NEW2 domain-containing protein [Streptomyces sp. DSM 41527]MDT0456880.1 NPCBM/NEW2 domain-containing protein [Streptomyces sp. DSM 41527]